MASDIIFCEAGYHEEECIDRWLNKGLNGVCFAEMDKEKYYKKLGGLEIFPLDEATTQYPDYILYLTQGYENLRPVTDSLIAHGIPWGGFAMRIHMNGGWSATLWGKIGIYALAVGLAFGKRTYKIVNQIFSS